MDRCQFVASLIYIPSSRTARSTQRNLVLGNQTKTKNIYLQYFVECNLPLYLHTGTQRAVGLGVGYTQVVQPGLRMHEPLD